MYRALYRKWRPATFDDVIGQDNIVTALKSQLLHNKVGHAYIFTGTRGTGKTTCAKIFAKAVNCLNLQNASPCCECAMCEGIQSGAILDVVEIDAASNNGVDNIRDLREETAYTPGAGKFKVFIIDEVHMLSAAAFNALLKIMEEPPSHVIFILATTEIHKVPATILSRCQRYDFVRINATEIAKRLEVVAKEENITLSEKGACLIARLAQGAMRDALSLLDTCSNVSSEVDEETVRKMAGVTDKSYLFELSESIYSGDIAKALLTIANLMQNSVDMKRLCDELILHYRNIMLAAIKSDYNLLSGVSEDEEKRYYDAAKTIGTKHAIYAIKILSLALERMAKSADLRITLETAVFAICEGNFRHSAPQEVQSLKPTSIPVTASNNAKAFEQSTENTHKKPENSLSTPLNDDEKLFVNEQEAAELKADENDSLNDAYIDEPHIHDEFEKVDELEQPGQINEPSSDYTGEQESIILAQNSTENNSVQITKSEENMPDSSEIMQDFECWSEVVNRMQEKDKLLYIAIKGTKAYFDGKRIRIDGSDLFLEYMRENKYSNELIREIIYEVSGRNYAIAPYIVKKQAKAIKANIEDTINNLKAHNVPVIYEDNKP